MIERPIPSEEIFHGPLGDIVDILDPHTEADPIGVLMSLMTMYSVAIGPEPSVKVGNTNQKLAVWTILAGDSGVGRKGTATGDARMVVEKAIPHLFDRTSHLVSAPNSGAGFVADLHSRALQNDWVVKKEDEDGEEYVTGLLPGFPALMIVPEMAAVFRTNRVDTTLSQNLREAWEGGSLSNVTKKESIVVDSPHVGIIGHITPTELETSLSESDSGGGTANRLLWVFVERSKRLKLGGNLTSEELEKAASMFKEAVDFAADFGGTVTLSQEAKKYWLDVVYDEIDDLILSSETVKTFAARSIPYAYRLAALYALSCQRTVISVDDLAAAAGIIRYVVESINHITRNFKSADKEQVINLFDNGEVIPENLPDRLVRVLQRNGGSLSARNSSRNLRVSAAQVDQAAWKAGNIIKVRRKLPTGRWGVFYELTQDQTTQTGSGPVVEKSSPKTTPRREEPGSPQMVAKAAEPKAPYRPRSQNTHTGSALRARRARLL